MIYTTGCRCEIRDKLCTKLCANNLYVILFIYVFNWQLIFLWKRLIKMSNRIPYTWVSRYLLSHHIPAEPHRIPTKSPHLNWANTSLFEAPHPNWAITSEKCIYNNIPNWATKSQMSTPHSNGATTSPTEPPHLNWGSTSKLNVCILQWATTSHLSQHIQNC
jgi:hypothetical protein